MPLFQRKGKYKKNRNSDLHVANLLKLDVSKACHFLNWKILYDIKQGIKKTIDWYKKYYSNIGKKKLHEYTLKDIKEYERKIQDENGKDTGK